MNLKWQMIDGYLFTAMYDEYKISVVPFGSIYPDWVIEKNDVVIDSSRRHHPVTTTFNKELAAKVQAERAMDVILK